MDFSFERSILLIGLYLGLFLNGAYSGNSTLYPPGFEEIPCRLSDTEEGVCVYAYLCRNGLINVDGGGPIDLRTGDECEDYFLKCCSKDMACAEYEGRCVLKSKCGVKLDTPKYQVFKKSTECGSNKYVCCPKNKVGQTPQDDPIRNVSEEACDENKSVCVPDEQCSVNPDGVAIIEPRTGGCSSLKHTCCPIDKVKTSSSDTCGLLGGRCVPAKNIKI